MDLTYQENTYLTIKDEYNKIINEIICIPAKSGYGKGLSSESVLEEFLRGGYTVINIADPKLELELAYAMFEPLEQYHLNHLKRVGKNKRFIPTKLYHPFTFNLPKKPLPEFDFFTFSLKELGRKEWGMIAETEWDTDTIKLLNNASGNITNEDGIYGFMHYLQEAIRGKAEGRSLKPDWKNFGLEVTSGTVKSMQDIANYMQPFKRDYFLSKHNSKTLLDWRSIINDNKHYHVFVTNWIKDPKMREFVVMTLFNKIIENKDYATKPIIVFIPEIRFLTPFKPQGYKYFLAKAIKDNLSMMRSMGRGMSCLMDTQVWSGVDEDVRNSPTTTLIGELGGASDKEKLGKANRYGKETQKLLSKQESKNTYMIQGKEDLGNIRTWFPSHMHCEPNYNFFEMYKKHMQPEMIRKKLDEVKNIEERLKTEKDTRLINFLKREKENSLKTIEHYKNLKLKSYEDLIIEKKREYDEEESKFKEKIKKRELQRKREHERLTKEKEKKSETKVEEKKSEKVQEKLEQTNLMQGKIFYEMFHGEPPMKLRAIQRKFGIPSHNTVKSRMRMWEDHLKKKEGKDYAEEAVEDFNGNISEEDMMNDKSYLKFKEEAEGEVLGEAENENETQEDHEYQQDYDREDNQDE